MKPMEYGNWSKAREARVAAVDCLRKWGVEGSEDGSYRVLNKLLGHNEDFDIMEQMTEADVRLCDLLTGPHGFAVYKMLLARRGLL